MRGMGRRSSNKPMSPSAHRMPTPAAQVVGLKRRQGDAYRKASYLR